MSLGRSRDMKEMKTVKCNNEHISLCTIEYILCFLINFPNRPFKAYSESGDTAPLIPNLNSWWRWVVILTNVFASEVRAPCTHLMWGCVGPSDGLDVSEERKISCFCWNFNLGLPVIWPDHWIDHAVLALWCTMCMISLFLQDKVMWESCLLVPILALLFLVCSPFITQES